MNYNYYTDGSCKGNGTINAVGAWGFVLVDDKDQQLYWKCEKEENTTNQRQELKAVINACKHSEQYNDGFTDINIYSDSAYIIRCYKERWYNKWMTNGWVNSKKEKVANKDLWEELLPYFNKANYNFYKVKGHSNNYLNNVVDMLVQTEASK